MSEDGLSNTAPTAKRVRTVGLSGFGKSFTQLPTPVVDGGGGGTSRGPPPPRVAVTRRIQTVPALRAIDIEWGERLRHLRENDLALLLQRPMDRKRTRGGQPGGPPVMMKIAMDCGTAFKRLGDDGQGLQEFQWVLFDHVEEEAVVGGEGEARQGGESSDADPAMQQGSVTAWRQDLGSEDAQALEELLRLWTERHQKK